MKLQKSVATILSKAIQLGDSLVTARQVLCFKGYEVSSGKTERFSVQGYFEDWRLHRDMQKLMEFSSKTVPYLGVYLALGTLGKFWNVCNFTTSHFFCLS